MQSGTIPELIFRLWEPIRLQGQQTWKDIQEMSSSEWTAWISVQNWDSRDSGVFLNDFSRYLLFSMDHRAESRYNGNMASKRRRGLGKCKEEGYGFMDTGWMYLSCQSMIAENIYTLTVIYNEGKTRNLKIPLSVR